MVREWPHWAFANHKNTFSQYSVAALKARFQRLTIQQGKFLFQCLDVGYELPDVVIGQDALESRH